ncbi:MAG: MMPL family transporter [Lentisphaeria bacterium]|nr:MMPL family transporter [Lentisphaeria bacterium]
MKLVLTQFSLRRPKLVMALILIVTLGLASQFPKVHFDNDPENMLAHDEPVRLFHDEVKEKYALYDFVIAGVVNEQDEDGIFNPDTLGRVHVLTDQLLSLRPGPDGLPQVQAGGETRALDLRPASRWQRVLNFAFRHDPNRLFAADGTSAIVGRELIAPSVVDNLKQAEFGSLLQEYLMPVPPRTREEARTIRDDALGNPLYKGTLVAEDGKALCLYIPLTEKTFSHNVATLVRELTRDWPAEDQVHITGLPVAEDTFGVEMLVQMATSAPLAGIAIFLLLLLFFRRPSLIVAPMVLAVVTILCTMGLLIGSGYDVHIMSSMIAIFLMPISVADSVHILSEFFDVYHRFNDKKEAVRHVIGHLFMPMLYTSLTTVAGFASLATTPIPPVKVFGLHVAFGVALAWVLTMTFIPAYIMLFVPKRTLERLSANRQEQEGEHHSALARLLEPLGRFSYLRWRTTLFVALAIVAVSVYGITRINVNDNPVRWFTSAHPIRVADRVLNEHFGGTYTAYLTFEAARPEGSDCQTKAARLAAAAQQRFAAAMPTATEEFLGELKKLEQLFGNVHTSDVKACLVRLATAAGEIDGKATRGWNLLADEINYLDPEGLTAERLAAAVRGVAEAGDQEKQALLERLARHSGLAGAELQEKALAICEEFTALSFRAFVLEQEAELTAPLFKQPPMLRWLEGLQVHLARHPLVGKSSSAADPLKKGAYELNFVPPPADADAAERNEYEARNQAHNAVPPSAAACGQVFTQLEQTKKKDSLFHLVTRDYQQANLWIQLKSGDNRDMEQVVAAVEDYLETNPPPVKLVHGWAGLTYINVVWQDQMVVGMLWALGSSAIIVFVMMLVLFRSFVFGVLSMIPLSITIAFTYGLIGLMGKDYDMPVAVLSSLTLGLSVDFAIHFLERARELRQKLGSWEAAAGEMFKEPATAISRNAITIAIGFTPLLLAPLVPYRTVGFFLASIMAVSWLATLFLLPALITPLQRFVFRETAEKQGE